MLKTRVRPALAFARDRAIDEEDERYNPIRPSNGNRVIHYKGGSDVSRSSRNPRFSMAAARAGDIQTRRLTPGTGATPTMGLSEVRGGAYERYVGGAAVPSMGLSEFRGGAYLEQSYLDNFTVPKLKQIVKKLNTFSKRLDPSDYYVIRHKADASKDEIIAEILKAQIDRDTVNDIAQLFPVKVKKMKGGSTFNDLMDHTNVARSGAYEGQGRSRKSMPPVAMRGGKHYNEGHALSEHLMASLGKTAHKKLMGGMMAHAHGCHGGAWWDDLKRGFEDFGAKVKNEFVNPESVLRGKVLPAAAKVGTVLAPVINAAGTAVGVPGVGTAISSGLNTAESINQGAKSVGLGRRGCGKKRRAPASASDGRRKRADIVRKVMNERGISMIEASKIVKSEGLY
jgi:hypothetical protein